MCRKGRVKSPAFLFLQLRFGLADKPPFGYLPCMKRTLTLVLPILFCGSVFAQEAKTNAPLKIAAVEAKKHVGEEAIVTGTVAEINKIQSLVRLNIDKPYPNQSITFIVFSDKTNLFPEIDKLHGKTLEVTGKIIDYRGRPEIVLANTNQLKTVESQKATEAPEKK